MEYFYIAFPFFVIGLIEILKYNRWYSVVFLTFFSLLMVLFAGLRDGSIVGTDSPAYFRNYFYGYWDVEWGYKYLNILFSKILNLPYNTFLIFLNGISLFLLSRFIKNMSFF